MSIPRIAALLMICLVAVSATSGKIYADQVDDLLAGKAVEIKQQTVVSEGEDVSVAASTDSPHSGSSNGAQAKSAGTKASVPKGTLSEKSWEVTLAEPSHTGIVDEQTAEASSRTRTAAPPAMVSVVPEPSAIALAAGALVYFLIFFRRRYSF